MSVNSLKKQGHILDMICQKLIKRTAGMHQIWLKQSALMDKSVGYFVKYDIRFDISDLAVEDLACIEIKDRVWVALPLDNMNKKSHISVHDFDSMRQSFAWDLSYDLGNANHRYRLTTDLIAQSPYIAKIAQNHSGFRGSVQDWTELDKTQAMQNFYKEYERVSLNIEKSAGFVQTSWIDWKSFKCEAAIPLVVYSPEKRTVGSFKSSGPTSDRPSYTYDLDKWDGYWSFCEDFVKAKEL